MKTEEETQEVLDRIISSNKKFNGQSYEQGLNNALEWVMEQWEEDETPADEY